REEQVLEKLTDAGVTSGIDSACCLSCRGDRVAFIGTIQMPSEGSHVAHRYHRIGRELALNIQVEVHGIRSGQVGIVGVDAHWLKEAKVKGCVAHRRRGERELVRNRSRACWSRPRIGETWTAADVTDSIRAQAEGRCSEVLQSGFLFETVEVDT